MAGVCSVEGCPKGTNKRRMCSAHDQRNRKYGNPHMLANGPDMSLVLSRSCATCGVSIDHMKGNAAYCTRRCKTAAAGQRRELRNPYRNHMRNQAKMSGDSALVTAKDWSKLVARFGGRCAYCDRPGLALQKEHVIPLGRGGRHSIGNLLPACLSCNSSKRDALLVEWRYGRRRGACNPFQTLEV